MRAFVAGDPLALDEIDRRYRPRLVAYLGRRFPALDPEDLVQETFYRVVRFRDSFRNGFPLAPWLYAIARNAGLAWRSHGTGGAWSGVGGALAADPGTEPDRMLESSEAALALDRAMTSLSDLDREVLLLSRHEGMTYVEIAATLGSTPGAVKVRAFRALSKLREAMKEHL